MSLLICASIVSFALVMSGCGSSGHTSVEPMSTITGTAARAGVIYLKDASTPTK